MSTSGGKKKMAKAMDRVEDVVAFVAEEESLTIDVGEVVTDGYDLVTHASHSKKTDKELPKVTVELVGDVLEGLWTDNCLPSGLQDSIKMLDSFLLLEKLQEFEHCLVPRRKNANASQEAAYKNYNAAFIQKHAAITEITGSVAATAWISLRLFERLVKEAYGSERVEILGAANEIKDDERDVIRYVGGCVIKKLQQRLLRLQKSPYSNEKLACLEALTCSENPVKDQSDMTTLLNRGGLTFVTPTILTMFYELEMIFRQLIGEVDGVNIKPSEFDFLTKCTANEKVAQLFYVTLYGQEITPKVEEDVLDNICCLFFKIRIHHKLKTMMDRIKREWREKSLRKRLKVCNVEKSGH